MRRISGSNRGNAHSYEDPFAWRTSSVRSKCSIQRTREFKFEMRNLCPVQFQRAQGCFASMDPRQLKAIESVLRKLFGKAGEKSLCILRTIVAQGGNGKHHARKRRKIMAFLGG